MKARAKLILLLPACAAFAGCGGSGGPGASFSVPAPLTAVRGAASPAEFVGYWDGWQKNNLVDTPSGVTEIPIAFGYLRGHTITLSGLDSGYVTADDINELHSRGIKVTLSLGGWSPKDSFVFDGNVKGFEQSLADVLATLPLDGVDFDMEHGATPDRVKTLTTLIPVTRDYFNSIGMTGAIVTYPAWNTPTQYGDDRILENSNVAGALSWVNVMSYENNNVSQTESDVAAYGQIFDKSRIMMGVDIDDKPIPTDKSLKKLAAWVNANGYGGMMAWTVNSITTGQLDSITGQ